MSRERAAELFVRWQDGELDEADTATLADLLAGDAELLATCQREHALHLVLRGRRPAGCGPSLADRVLAVVEDSTTTARYRLAGRVRSIVTRRRQRALLALAAALVIAVGLAWWAPWSGPTGSPEVAPLAPIASDCLPVVGGEAGATVETAASPRGLEPGERLPPAAVVDLAAGAPLVLRYDDGTTLSVFGPGRFRLGGTADGRKLLHLDAGRIDADVQRQDPARPMLFTTAQARATVLGTRLELTACAEGSRLLVTGGTVRWEPLAPGATGEEVTAGGIAVVLDAVRCHEHVAILRAAGPWLVGAGPPVGAWRTAHPPQRWDGLAWRPVDPNAVHLDIAIMGLGPGRHEIVHPLPDAEALTYSLAHGFDGRAGAVALDCATVLYAAPVEPGATAGAPPPTGTTTVALVRRGGGLLGDWYELLVADQGRSCRHDFVYGTIDRVVLGLEPGAGAGNIQARIQCVRLQTYASVTP